MAYVDRVMDGLVCGGEEEEKDSGRGRGGGGGSSSGSYSSGSSSVAVNNQHQQLDQDHQQQQQQQRIRDGRERLVLLTTMGERDVVMELNMFPYACPEVVCCVVF